MQGLPQTHTPVHFKSRPGVKSAPQSCVGVGRAAGVPEESRVEEPPEGHRALSRAHPCAEILKDPL